MRQLFILLAPALTSRYNEIDMKSGIQLWIWGILFLVSNPQNGLAQSLVDDDSIFDSIKIQMTSVAKENIALVQQNKKLKAQLVSLQLEVAQHEKELEELDSNYVVREKTINGQYQEQSNDLNNSRDIHSDPLIKEAQDLYLSGQSMDLTLEQELKELYLFDLQIQKQEYLLDLKDKEALYNGIELKWQQDLGIYQKEIQKNLAKESELSRKVAEMERKALSYPREIDMLKMENKELMVKISILKKMLSK